MWFEPKQAERFVLADKPLNHSATLSDRRTFNGKLNRNYKKLKQRCYASNTLFFARNEKIYQINPLFVQKLSWSLCIWNLMTNVAL